MKTRPTLTVKVDLIHNDLPVASIRNFQTKPGIRQFQRPDDDGLEQSVQGLEVVQIECQRDF